MEVREKLKKHPERFEHGSKDTNLSEKTDSVKYRGGQRAADDSKNKKT